MSVSAPELRPDFRLRWFAEVRATFALALPIGLANLAQMGIGMTDVIMLGWLGPAQLAAGVLAAHLLFPLHFFAAGVVSAVAPIIAQALGARQYRQIRRAVRQGMWVSLALSLPICVILWFGREVLLAFGQAERSAELGGEYLGIALWGFLPSLGFVVLRSFVASHSRPRSALVVITLAIAVNAVSNYALMFGHFGFPRLELAGAAISSVIVHLLTFLVLLGYVLRDRRLKRYRILVRFWRPDWPLFREILRVGLPIGLTHLAEAGMFAFSTFMMGLIGTIQVAAHAIATQCAGIVYMLPLGIAHAATVRVGYESGAGNHAGARRAGWTALSLGLIAVAANMSLLWFGDRAIVTVFLGDAVGREPVLAAQAVAFLHLCALFQLFDTTQGVAAGVLRGLKDTRVPMVIANVGYWGIGAVASAVFAFWLDLGGAGIWYGLLLGLAVVAVLLTHRFHRLSRLPAG